MNIIAFVGAGIIGAVLSSVLKQYKPEFSIYITLITGMLMLGAAVSAVKPVIETVSGYLETAVPDSEAHASRRGRCRDPGGCNGCRRYRREIIRAEGGKPE